MEKAVKKRRRRRGAPARDQPHISESESAVVRGRTCRRAERMVTDELEHSSTKSKQLYWMVIAAAWFRTLACTSS